MDAEIVALAKRVVILLNEASAAGELGGEFTAEREYAPEFELPKMVKLHFTVVGVQRRSKRITRVAWEHDYDIDVGIMQRVGRQLEDLDEKMKLPEQVGVFFDSHEVGDGTEFLAHKIAPYYD
nr:hypothetical protein [Gemmatimonadales bacterium]